MLWAQGLAYPLVFTQGAMGDLVLFALEPQVQAALSGLRYEAIHLLLPGPKTLLAVSAYLPQDLPDGKRQEVRGLLRSLEFVAPKDRVPYRTEALMDPLLGVPAAYLPVPQGYAFQGSVVAKGGTLRAPAFQLTKGGVVLRRDVIYLEAMAVATPFGGNPSTILLWNGQLGQVPGYLCAGLPGRSLPSWPRDSGLGKRGPPGRSPRSSPSGGPAGWPATWRGCAGPGSSR